ncbi:hypothetical protein AAMO2058_000227400 [Amorphochlora amoebiformis]
MSNVAELKTEVAKLQQEVERLQKAISPEKAAQELLEFMKKQDIDPIMAEDNPWKPRGGGCCVVS